MRNLVKSMALGLSLMLSSSALTVAGSAQMIYAESECNAVFYLDAEGTEVYESVSFAADSRLTAPEDPEGELTFNGWYTADGEEFSSMKKYSEDIEFFANWVSGYRFEAENTQLTGLDYAELGDNYANQNGEKRGHNASGSAYGKMLIRENEAASNGKYVSGLCYDGAYLDFELEADQADDNATLTLSVAAWYVDLTIDDEIFQILVNDEPLSYNEMTLKCLEEKNESAGNFVTITVSGVALEEGENLVEVLVNNENRPAEQTGTIYSTAPAIDYLGIQSTAAITMTEYDN